MSECSGPMTVGNARRNLSGSCGTAVEGLQMKIHEPDKDGNGEVQYGTAWYNVIQRDTTCQTARKNYTKELKARSHLQF